MASRFNLFVDANSIAFSLRRKRKQGKNAIVAGAIAILTMSAVLAAFAPAITALQIVQTRAEDFYARGIGKTQREDYPGAIADLQRAATLFSQQRNPANAYKSKALAIFLQFEVSRLQPIPSSEPIPGWYKLGQCLDDCQYGITWIAPEAERTNFGGVLVLQKKLRMLDRPDGSGEPINAILDAGVVPKLRAGELLQSNCRIVRRLDPEILAIVQLQGFENAEFYPKVRQAWRINLRNQKIETVPTTNISCINPCPGGC